MDDETLERQQRRQRAHGATEGAREEADVRDARAKGLPSAEEERSRCDFLAIVDHQPHVHAIEGSSGEVTVFREFGRDAEYERLKRDTPWKIVDALIERKECHWWWCRSPEQVGSANRWDDLRTAASLLLAGSRDLNSPEANKILWGYNGARLWRLGRVSG